MKLSKRSWQWAIVAYCFVILLLSVLKINGSSSLSKIEVAGFRSDYLLHVMLFVPFMLLVQWRWGGAGRGKLWFWLAIGAGLALAAVSEGIQYFLPYRKFNIMDFVANGLGVVLGSFIAWCWGRVWHR